MTNDGYRRTGYRVPGTWYRITLLEALALGFAICFFASGLRAQTSTNESKLLPPPTPAAASAEPGSELTVTLLTMGPGDEVWEEFGHNAIWIHDEAHGTDIAYHWGVFDFRDKDFYPNFIRGKMRYLMGAFDFNETVDAYRQTNRTVWAQELNLTPAQRYSLAQFIAWNVRPENRYYHYDYYRDNCSTRVRDALDAALGGVIKRASESVPTGTTYRFHTGRLTQGDWPVFTGTMAGLGEPTDRPITAYEEMFLPVKLKDHLRTMRVSTNGVSVPLVKSERVLVQATRVPEAVDVQRGIAGYLAIAGILLLIGGGLLFAQSGKPTAALLVAALWSVVAGLGGMVLAGLWAFTDHIYSYRNENVLQMTPLSLVLLVLLIRVITAARDAKGNSAHRVSSAYRWALIVAALSVAGFLIQALPMFNQVNGDIVALAMPLHIGVALMLLALTRRTELRDRPKA